MADSWDEQFRQRAGMHCLVCDPISADIISALNRYIEREQVRVAAIVSKLRLAEKKLKEHEIEWDGEKYAFTPRSSYPEDFGHVCTPGCNNPCED